MKILIVVPITMLLFSATIYPFLPHGGSIETEVPGSMQSTSWKLGGGNATGFLRPSSNISLNGRPSIQFGAGFNVNVSKVFIFLDFNHPENLTEEDYLLFWLYVGPDLAYSSPTFASLLNVPFGFNVTLTAKDGGSKTYGLYSIRWQGWGQLAFPLHYRGTLSGQNQFAPSYIGVQESNSWSDDSSLEKIVQIRLDLIVSSTAPETMIHSLSLNDLRTSRQATTSLELLDSVIGAVAVYSSLLVLPAYLAKYTLPNSKSVLARRFLSLFAGFQVPFKHAKIFWSIISLKIIIASITPLSSDFIDIVRSSTPVEPNLNLFANSPLFGGFMTVLHYAMYRFWLLLPVDHIDLLQIFPGSYYFPAAGVGIFNFPVSAGAFLLVLLLKTPNVISDILLAVVIQKFALRITGSSSASTSASMFWLVNPFTTLIGEMWANFDMIFVLFLVLSIYSLVRGRLRWSALLLALSAGVRLWSILLLPFLGSMLMRNPLSDTGSIARSKEALKYTGLTMLFFLIAVSPFLITNSLSGGTKQIIYPDASDLAFSLGLGLQLFDYTILLLVGLLVTFLFVLYDAWKPQPREAHRVLLAFFLIFFALARWQAQWFLWIIPFLALDYGVKPKFWKYPVFYSLTILPLVFVEAGFYFSTWGNSLFFFPNLNPEMALLSERLFILIHDPLVVNLRLAALLESVLFGVSLAYILKLYRDRKSSSISG